MSSDTGFLPLENFSRDRNCFACGRNNPVGLKMTFSTDGQCIVSELSVSSDLCGWGQLVHGGILATIMDETMSWSAIHLLRRFILTKSMQIDFLKPVPVATPLRAEGRIDRLVGEKEAVVQAVLYVKDQAQPCVRATGRFALFSSDLMRRKRFVDAAVIDDFEAHFSKLPDNNLVSVRK